jgi:twinkle protein
MGDIEMTKPVIITDIPSNASDVWRPAGYRAFIMLESEANFSADLVEQLSEVDAFVLDVVSDAWREELARRLGRHRCRWTDGAASVAEADDVVSGAIHWPVDGEITVDAMGEGIDQLYEADLPPGLSTGWAAVDELFTVNPARITVITGIPSHGKSSWMEMLALNLTASAGWKWGIFSPEHAPYSRHFLRLAEKFIGKPVRSGFVGRPKMDLAELETAKAAIGSHFFWLEGGPDGMEFDRLMDMARQMVTARGINGLIVDPFNELSLPGRRGDDDPETIGNCIRAFRRLSRATGLHVFILAHPTKMELDKRTNTYPPPRLYNISGTAHWRNRVDFGITVHRAKFGEPGGEVLVLVEKAKWDNEGKPGHTSLYYQPWCGRYTSQQITQEPIQ